MPIHIKKGSKRHNYCDVQTAVQRHKERCPRSSTGPRCPAKSGITPPTSQPRREPSAFKSEQSELILSTGHQDSTVLPCAHQPGACGARCSASMPMLMWELEPHVVCVPPCRQSVLRTLPRHTASTPCQPPPPCCLTVLISHAAAAVTTADNTLPMKTSTQNNHALCFEKLASLKKRKVCPVFSRTWTLTY